MPASVVKTARDEHLWDRAKGIAEKEGRTKDYAYIMGIFQRMKGLSKSSEIEGKIAAFLEKNPKPDDKAIHAMADELGMNPHRFEEKIYALLGKKLNTDQLSGGVADGKKPSDFDPGALKEGMKVEAEHTKNKKLRREIAMDHLTEDKKYYKKLKRMEAQKSLTPELDDWLEKGKKKDAPLAGQLGLFGGEVAPKKPKAAPEEGDTVHPKQVPMFSGSKASEVQAAAEKKQQAAPAAHGGPFIGPRGGKWADAKHTIPWVDPAEAAKKQKAAEHHNKQANHHLDLADTAGKGTQAFEAHRSAAEAHVSARVAHEKNDPGAKNLSAKAQAASDHAAAMQARHDEVHAEYAPKKKASEQKKASEAKKQFAPEPHPATATDVGMHHRMIENHQKMIDHMEAGGAGTEGLTPEQKRQVIDAHKQAKAQHQKAKDNLDFGNAKYAMASSVGAGAVHHWAQSKKYEGRSDPASKAAANAHIAAEMSAKELSSLYRRGASDAGGPIKAEHDRYNKLKGEAVRLSAEADKKHNPLDQMREGFKQQAAEAKQKQQVARQKRVEQAEKPGGDAQEAIDRHNKLFSSITEGTARHGGTTGYDKGSRYKTGQKNLSDPSRTPDHAAMKASLDELLAHAKHGTPKERKQILEHLKANKKVAIEHAKRMNQASNSSTSGVSHKHVIHARAVRDNIRGTYDAIRAMGKKPKEQEAKKSMPANRPIGKFRNIPIYGDADQGVADLFKSNPDAIGVINRARSAPDLKKGMLYEVNATAPNCDDYREEFMRRRVSQEIVVLDDTGRSGNGGLDEWFTDAIHFTHPELVNRPVSIAKSGFFEPKTVVLPETPFEQRAARMPAADSQAGLDMWTHDNPLNRRQR
jgi:hypothetical protein